MLECRKITITVMVLIRGGIEARARSGLAPVATIVVTMSTFWQHALRFHLANTLAFVLQF
jgi:uncharacterized membrane protein YjdF